MSNSNTSREVGRASHTPGPWIADDIGTTDDACVRISAYDGTSTYYHHCKVIGECWMRDDEEDRDSPHVLQAEANARLIAAAPELLALAKQSASECLSCNYGDGATGKGSEGEPCEECAHIHAVIARAEGRS